MENLKLVNAENETQLEVPPKLTVEEARLAMYKKLLKTLRLKEVIGDER